MKISYITIMVLDAQIPYRSSGIRHGIKNLSTGLLPSAETDVPTNVTSEQYFHKGPFCLEMTRAK